MNAIKLGLTKLLFLLMILPAAAQETEPEGGASRVRAVFNLPRQFFYFDITHNTWLNAPEGVKTNFISPGLNVNFFYEFNISSSWFGIAPGLSYATYGVKSNSIYHYTYADNPPKVAYTSLILIEDSNITTSKLSLSYFEIPLEVHIHSKPKGEKNKSFMIAPGFRAGILLNDFWKYTYDDTYTGSTKVKVYDIEHLSIFRYGVSLRLTYYKFGLFGYYQLNNLFEKDKGPDIKPLSVGITLSPF